jgi:hypothetical protein
VSERTKREHDLADDPGGNRMILAMTPASTAIATARVHMNSSDSSPAGGDEAEHATDFTGQEADEHKERIGMEFAHLSS